MKGLHQESHTRILIKKFFGGSFAVFPKELGFKGPAWSEETDRDDFIMYLNDHGNIHVVHAFYIVPLILCSRV